MASPLLGLCRAGMRAQLSPATRFRVPRCTRSASSSTRSSSSIPGWKVANFATIGVLMGAAAFLYSTDTRASVHRHVVPKLLRGVIGDAEDAHNFGTAALRVLYSLGLHPRERASFNSTYIP